MKKFFLPALGILFLFILNYSCTVLQWRESDEEIHENFKALGVAHAITYFDVDSLDLKVRILTVARNKRNIDLIFFHGSPSSLSAWNGYLKDSLLQNVANLHAIDRPGYGYSNFGDEMTSIETQAQIMSAMIDDKNLKNVIAIGSSYGGPLAARIALINSNIKGVVMISPAIDPEIEKEIWAAKFTQWKLTRWLVPTGYRVAGDEKKVHAQELALLQNDWKNITIPVVHIHGTIDDLVPYENIEFSKANFQNIEIISIPEKGHEIAWKNPKLMIPYITKLIHQLEQK